MLSDLVMQEVTDFHKKQLETTGGVCSKSTGWTVFSIASQLVQ
jgi:hypothetical protein